MLILWDNGDEFAIANRNRRCFQAVKGRFIITKIIPEVSGQAALAICESLLLALNDLKILPEKEIIGLLKDAASTHQNAAESGDKPDFNRAVASLINGIIDGGNSVRRR